MLFSVFLISAAVLAYEILLMRLFSITQWHHFAYMIISIALLGFGASGTCISLFAPIFKKRFRTCYRCCTLLFLLALFVSYFLSQRNTFNPFEIVWDWRQYLHLLEYYLILFVPFFFAATCIGLLITRFADKIGVIYCANLLGSGVGAVGVILCLSVVHPVHVIYAIAALASGGFAATFFDRSREGDEGRQRTVKSKSILSAALLSSLVILVGGLAMRYDPLHLRNFLQISQYKGLSQAKKFPDAEVREELVSPLGVVQVVSSPIIRNAPGLSVKYTGEMPPQIALFIDSGNAGVMTGSEELAFLDFLSSALAYHIRPAPRVLILGAGGGMDVLNALFHQATSVDAVELDQNVISLVTGQFADFTGGLYSRPEVRILHQEARGYIETTASAYDAIHISLLDSFGASSAGVHALHENYLYTVEALQQYYTHLTPQGMLSITRWVKFPPRDNIKLFATAVEALEELGIPDVDIPRHLVSIRSWATCTLVISKSPLTPEEIARIQSFCRERAFDTNYFPGILAHEANRYNQLPSAEYYQAARELLFGNRQAFYASYPYYVRPARDDSPYFFHFFTWRSFPTLLSTMGKEWIPFIEWGYLVLLATLLQAGFISIVLILLPLTVLSRRMQNTPGKAGSRDWHLYTVFYFTCLGLGYLFLEMVFIQKFLLFLADPAYTASVVIASFLIFSGFGSLYVETGNWKLGTRNSQVFLAIGGIVGLSLGYVVVLPAIFSFCSGWATAWRMLLTVGIIAPLGFCMGIPFPVGVHRLHSHAAPLIPWAYGINGCASVLSALIATSLAISWGFRAVMLLAGGLYLVAAGVTYGIVFRSQKRGVSA